MSEFDNTATTSVAELQVLETTTQDAIQTWSETEGKLTTFRENLKSQTSEVETRTLQLIDKLTQEKDSTNEISEQHTVSIADLNQKVLDFRQLLDGNTETANQSLEKINSSVDDMIPETQATVEPVVTGLNEVQSRMEEIDAEIESQVSTTQNFLLNELIVNIKEQQGNIEGKKAELQANIQKRIPEIQEKTAHFNEKLEKAVGLFEQRLAVAMTNNEQSSKENTENLQGNVQGNIAELVSVVQTLQSSITDIGGIIESIGNTAVTSKDLMLDGADLANVGASSALGAITEVKELLERFIKM